MDFVPDESALNTDVIEVDRDTMDMLRSMNMANLPGVQVAQVRTHTAELLHNCFSCRTSTTGLWQLPASRATLA